MIFLSLLFPEFKDKALTLSYDDGVRADVRLIDVMKKYGLKGTFNINSGMLDFENRIHADELRKVYIDSGNEVAIHGEFHYSLAGLPDERILTDVYNDRRYFEKLLGDRLVTGMAYANGSYDDRVVDVLNRCGITYSRTTVSTENFKINDDWLRLSATCHHNCPRLMELADKFLAPRPEKAHWANTGGARLFYLWGHSYEFDRDNNWDVIEKFAEKVGNREDVWYATNGEVYEYVEAFKSLKFSLDGTFAYNPSALDVYMYTTENEKVVVPAGKTARIKNI